jgi:hypothetical protein
MAALLLAGCATSQPAPTASPPLRSSLSFPTPAPISAADETVLAPPPTSALCALISQESLFATLEDLTAIQPYSGWRSSGSEGEAEAVDYMGRRLVELTYLEELGLELERQSFHVFTATELWETRLHLTVDGEEIEVHADGLRGHRDDLAIALRHDSDGVLNDSQRNPVVVTGGVALASSADQIHALDPADVGDKVLFVDYAAIDRAVLGKQQAGDTAATLLAKEPAGLVLVTRFSNVVGESHGSFVGDVSALNYVQEAATIPVLYVRFEDLDVAGITEWSDLDQIESARLTWDSDVFCPGTSTNLAARIPGADPSRALILGAHIDSPNAPGAMDNGSGSAALLEVARVLNEARIQPPSDLYLVWFGSEELGLYGSYHFASTHQELLDRTMAMLQMDCLLRPLDGIEAYLNLVSWSYGRLGDERLTWGDYLNREADRQGVFTYPVNYYGVESDNSAFSGFDVPNANMIYMNFPEMDPIGGVHYAGHMHDPYDTVELAREVGDALEQMVRVVLTAALETGWDDPALRVAPRPQRRALFVASHTEAVHMSPTTFTDLGMALTWEGFDVDLIPYGQPVTADDLGDVALVVALPVVDYPSVEGDPGLYDEAWDQEEIAALEAYVARGGLLVLTNSARRLKYSNLVQDPNEDWADANGLATRFGVTFHDGVLEGAEARTRGRSPLVEGVKRLSLAEANGVPFTIEEGQTLAQVGSEPAAALLDFGDAGGQVLVLADVGMLGNGEEEPANLPFWLNLARYAWSD